MFKFAVARCEFIPELLLRGLGCGLQAGDLCGQRVDGLGRSRVFLDHGFRRIAQLFDLGLKCCELRQKFGIGLDGLGRD